VQARLRAASRTAASGWRGGRARATLCVLFTFSSRAKLAAGNPSAAMLAGRPCASHPRCSPSLLALVQLSAIADCGAMGKDRRGGSLMPCYRLAHLPRSTGPRCCGTALSAPPASVTAPSSGLVQCTSSTGRAQCVAQKVDTLPSRAVCSAVLRWLCRTSTAACSSSARLHSACARSGVSARRRVAGAHPQSLPGAHRGHALRAGLDHVQAAVGRGKARGHRQVHALDVRLRRVGLRPGPAPGERARAAPWQPLERAAPRGPRTQSPATPAAARSTPSPAPGAPGRAAARAAGARSRLRSPSGAAQRGRAVWYTSACGRPQSGSPCRKRCRRVHSKAASDSCHAITQVCGTCTPGRHRAVPKTRSRGRTSLSSTATTSVRACAAGRSCALAACSTPVPAHVHDQPVLSLLLPRRQCRPCAGRRGFPAACWVPRRRYALGCTCQSGLCRGWLT